MTMTMFAKFLIFLRNGWFMTGITVALFIVAEIVFSIMLHDQDRQNVDHRAEADAYQGAGWTKEYYREFHESGQTRWVPYVYWRRIPYEGQYINIDSRGIRKSWKAKSVPADRETHPRIFFFGGSTLWGTGARDNFTIPSIFAKKLADRGLPVEVINFGESGYVSTQEMVLLLRELQAGNIPDAVIFYDGVNDMYSAYQQQKAGLPQNEFNRVREFNISGRMFSQAVWAPVIEKLSTIRFIKSAYQKLFASHSLQGAQKTASFKDSEQSNRYNEILANNVLDIYERNIEIVAALAEHYDFETQFYWQPHVFEKIHVTEYEKREQQAFSGNHPFAMDFFKLTHNLLKKRDLTGRGQTGFQDLSDMFSATPEPLFIDWCHLGETGNDTIAERLVMEYLSTINPESSVAPAQQAARLKAQ